MKRTLVIFFVFICLMSMFPSLALAESPRLSSVVEEEVFGRYSVYRIEIGRPDFSISFKTTRDGGIVVNNLTNQKFKITMRKKWEVFSSSVDYILPHERVQYGSVDAGLVITIRPVR